MTVTTLPANADLGQLRAQAKELRRAFNGGSPVAVARITAVHPGATGEIPLRDAQLVIAREHGQVGWRELVAAVIAQQTGGRDLHRWFGVELNNDTWDALGGGLSEHSPRREQEEALYAVYASTYHWMQAGTVANHGRGEYMIASVAVAIGQTDVAARHAARYAELIETNPAAFADWDRAFAAEIAARVAARSGRPAAAALKAEAQRVSTRSATRRTAGSARSGSPPHPGNSASDQRSCRLGCCRPGQHPAARPRCRASTGSGQVGVTVPARWGFVVRASCRARCQLSAAGTAEKLTLAGSAIGSLKATSTT